MNYDWEALGKLMGMVLAYAISSLGLLFAYVNYRRRIVKAEKVFTPLAAVLTGGIGAVVLGAVVLLLVAMGRMPAESGQAMTIGNVQQAATTGFSLTGLLVPAAIFLLSFILTWLLYRHFAGRRHAEHSHQPSPPTA
jgi:hypothetical protein